MKKRNAIALGILVMVVLVLAFFQTPLMARARALAWDVWTSSVGRVFQFGILHPPDTVYDEIENLRSENTRLKAELKDYVRIRRQLGTPPVDSLRTVPAAVVSRPIDTWHTRYVINKGIEDGVVLRAPVTVNESTLVGFVQEIHEKSAVIELLLSPATSLTVETVVAQDEVPPARGLLESRQYTALFLTTVPRDVPLQTGQAVVTTTKDTGLPYGLVIGTITEVISQENEAYQEAQISLNYDPDHIDAVQILVAP